MSKHDRPVRYERLRKDGAFQGLPDNLAKVLERNGCSSVSGIMDAQKRNESVLTNMVGLGRLGQKLLNDWLQGQPTYVAPPARQSKTSRYSRVRGEGAFRGLSNHVADILEGSGVSNISAIMDAGKKANAPITTLLSLGRLGQQLLHDWLRAQQTYSAPPPRRSPSR